MSFQSLTKYIKLLENDSFGEWQSGEEKDGVITIPYVSYTETVMEFIHELHDFAKKNSQYDMHNYQDVLDKRGIKDGKDIQGCDIDNVDAQIVLCMMMKVVRSDRFVEGTLIHYLQDSYFSKWLKRLKEIDMADAKEKIDKVIKEVWLNEICHEYGVGNLIREASLQCSLYHHLRNRLEAVLKENNLYLYPEFYFKDLKYRADLAIIEMDFTKDVNHLKDCVEDVVAIIELKYAGGNSDTISNYIKTDMPKIKEYIKNLNYDCQYYFGVIYENECEWLHWFDKRQTNNWANGYLTELNAGYINEEMIFEVNSCNNMNSQHEKCKCKIMF